MKVLCLILLVLLATVDSKLIGIIFNFLLSSLLANPPNPQQDEVQASDVRFFLFTRRNPDQAVELDQNSLNLIEENNPVKIIVHGWLESAARQWVQNMTREFLQKDDYNVIQVDYSKTASERYSVAVSQVRAVGAFVGRLITSLYANYGIPLASFHIIGHSLGAHVAGAAGKEVIRLTPSKVARITALDAAGPLFETPPLFSTRGLEKTDADLLDAIHTDGGVFGYRKPLGTADFFPNGGVAVQPGCPSISLASAIFNGQEGLDDLFCSHTKSYFYYIASINSDRFVSTKCSSWDKFQTGTCNDNLKVLMGDGYVYSPEATGNFYLRTNPNPPFTNNTNQAREGFILNI